MIFDKLISGEFSAGLDYEFFPALDKESTKLLVVLHGRGDSSEGFHWLPAALNLDAFHFLFLNAPNAYGPGFSWYGLPPHQAAGIVQSRQILFKLLQNIEQEFHIASEDIFLLGFSQGSLMATDVGLRYDKILGGIVGVSGYVFFEEEYPAVFSPVTRAQYFLITHGNADTVVPIEGTQRSVARLKSLGVEISFLEFAKAHTIDPDDELFRIRKFLLGRLSFRDLN